MKAKISTTSELLLDELWKELMMNEEQNSLLVYYNLDKFKVPLSVNDANICIQYLQDLGYVQNASIDEKTHIIKLRLHGSGIKHAEDKVEKFADAFI